MYTTVIFDLDGTLLDTLEDLYIAVNEGLKGVNMPLRTKEEVRSMVGNGAVNLMTRALGQNATPQLIESALTVFNSYYKVHCEDKTKPYDDVMMVLQTLKDKGVKIGVVSNKPNYAVQILVKNYFGDLVDFTLGEDEKNGIKKKPAPDSLLKTIQTLGGNLQSSVYVGDSEVDILTAKNTGIDCISCTWGFKDKKFLLENGAKVLVDTPLQMLEILTK